MEIKVPLYNVLNFFLTGIVSIGFLLMLFPSRITDFIMSDYYEKLSAMSEIIILVCICAVSYEIGLILNRAASVTIEPILKKAKIIRYNDDYACFVKLAKKVPMLNTLSREYALSRTSILQFLMLLALAVIIKKWAMAAIFAVCVTVFTLSCRKHSLKITKIMHSPEEM